MWPFHTELRLYFLCATVLFLSFVTGNAVAQTDSAAARTISDSTVYRAIYPADMKNKSKIYNRLWGRHYRNLYTTPIAAPSTTFKTLLGGVTVVRQADKFHGVYLEDNQQRLYMLKPLGGSTTFLESDFFQEMYSKSSFRGTYLDKFISDSYTIINPYTFMASDPLARAAGLNTNPSRIFYLPENSTTDTIATGSRIQDKLVVVIDVPDIHTQKNILTTNEMLAELQKDKSYVVDQDLYIRERVFDMLIGDWNKIPENWNWLAIQQNDHTIYKPLVIDRSHAFIKVDGVMFKQLLNVLTLGFIFDYDKQIKNIKKFNKLGYALDEAITAQSTKESWIAQANYLKSVLTDQEIETAFQHLPASIQGKDIDKIKVNLKKRRDNLDEIAIRYYEELQKTPVVTGTLHEDRIVVTHTPADSVEVRIYNKGETRPVFEKAYAETSGNELWIYGLDGDDEFIVEGTSSGKTKPVYLIGGKGENSYRIESGKKVRVYGYPSEKEATDTISNGRVILTNDSQLSYDYTKTKYQQTSFTPWGYYDSDLGINLGMFYTYTQYGFKRSPFTYQHRIGYSYLRGFMYRGIFPRYDARKSIHLDIDFGFPINNYNFFGFGNDTDGYKDKKRSYNRNNIRELNIAPSYHLELDDRNKFIFKTSFELFKVRNSGDKLINRIYEDDDRIFKTNYFSEVALTYQFKRDQPSFVSHLELDVTGGWKVNWKDVGRNFPYTEIQAELDLAFSKRFSWATMAKGRVLFSDKYEFYQAATTELRGFRSNRFLGKQSFYQYSDLRLDMGNLWNPFIPTKYGLFVGADYGRVWYPGEDSNKWHSSYGGGIWLIFINKIITKYSLFGSTDTVRFMFELGFGF